MNCTKNLISVILPVYNREEYIEECLQSIFHQTHQNYEIIIVDDGSTDSSYKICETFAANDERIKLFENAHGGVSAARNKALDNATGEFVFFLDSDDVIHPMLFETLITAMKNDNAAIGATDVRQVSNDNWHKVQAKLMNAQNDKGETVKHLPDDVINAAINEKSPLGCIGGVMMRRDLIGDTKFNTKIYIGEDFYFIYENIIKNTSAVFLKQKWYYARNHATNSSWDYGFKGFWTRFYRRKLVWESEEKFGRTDNANKQKSGAFYCFNVCIVKNKPYSSDSKKMRKVLREYKNEICPALTLKGKAAYFVCSHMPLTTLLMLKLLK